MKQKRILTIEDDPLNMKLFRTILKIRGYDILEATEAESGLNLVEKHRPDLILMDIQLPRMDGLAATGQLKEHPELRKIPVVALTSHAMEGDKEKAIAAGCDGYIAKPIQRHKFLEHVERILGAPEPGESPQKKSGHQDRVLIVDDEPLNIKLIAGQLQNENYDILTALSGKEALGIVNAKNPDIILLDIMMPEMNGYEVIRKLKANPDMSHIPVIVITALTQSDHSQMSMDAGADDFLNKPINEAELRARIKSLIRLNKYHQQLTNRSETETFFSVTDNRGAGSLESDQTTVLLVEDDVQDIRLMRHYLDALPIRLVVVQNGDDALRAIHEQSCDVVLLDIFLPGTDGFDSCRRIKEKDDTRNIQIVVVTAMDDLDNRIRCIELGADDCLVKPVHREEIKARVQALIKKKKYLDRLSMKYETTIQAAVTDKLTGLFNQTFFKHSLVLEVKRVLRHRQAMGLLMIDVDDFRRHNDTHGHLVGDDVLHKIGNIIKSNIREVDLAARYGGEEFSVLLPYVDEIIAVEVAERIRRAIEKASLLPKSTGTLEKVTVSVGVSIFPSDAEDAEKLLKQADMGLYRAKRGGKNQVCRVALDPRESGNPALKAV